jgi:hypothetical protein
MKILKYTTYIIAAGLLFFVSSCKKYLDEKPDSSLVVTSSIDDMQALLDDAENINNATPGYMEATSDDYFLTQETYNSLSTNEQNAYHWTSFDYNWQNDWSSGYLPIYTSNLCLERIEKVPQTIGNRDKWNNIKGSALFFRAYYFLNLAWQFAKAYDSNTSETDLGIVLRLQSDYNIRSVRSSVEATYQRIIIDGKESLLYLGDHPLHVMRPSKAAAYGLLARTYLSMHQADSALKYSNLCLGIKSNLLNYNTDVEISSPAPFSKFNKETIFYSEISLGQGLYAPYSFYAFVDTNLFSGYAANDLRKEAYFSSAGNYYTFKGNYTEDMTMFSGIATDEMYLTRAECYARLGNKDAALADLNLLLSNRWKTLAFDPLTAGNATEALNLVLVERRKELLFRGLRWPDIKRLNKEGRNIVLKREIGGEIYQLLPNDNRYALPLPKDIIDQTGMAQN